MAHYEIRAYHFQRLNGYRQSAEYANYARSIGAEVPTGDLPSLLGDRWEIDAETYREFLEMLPPLNRLGDTFYLSEFSFGDITTKYTKEGDRYFCEFARYPARSRAVETPWGAADSFNQLGPGIVSYSTPSHGGIWLSPERVAEMPKPLRDFKPYAKGPGPGRWFEEDCDWSVVALAFPLFFDGDAIAAAAATLKSFRPELYEQIAGKSRYGIYYGDRELARVNGDPQLGVVFASDKAEAEALARQDGEIISRAMPTTSLWAVEIKEQAIERQR